MKINKGLEILNARPQCMYGWFKGKRCKRVATKWIGSTMYCSQHAKIISKKLKEKNKREK